MILYLILFLLVVIAAFFAKAKGPQYFKRFLIILAIAVISIISLRFGKSLFAIAAIAVPFIFKFLHFGLRNIGILKYLAAFMGGKKTSKVNKNVKLSTEEAYEVLGLKKGASKDEVKLKYKKLMKANHPDQGGSEHLACLLNAAKDKLL